MKLPAWARAKPSRYVLALDEAGIKTIKPSVERKVFAFGGVVIPHRSLDRARRVWTEWVGSFDLEDAKAASLESAVVGWQEDLDKRFELFQAFVSVVIGELGALPSVVMVDKGEVGEGLLVPTRTGRSDVSQGMLGQLLQANFAVFLERRGATGLVRCDQLGSSAEQARFMRVWSEGRSAAAQDGRPTDRIEPEVEFVRSHECPEVQMAGVLVAVLRRLQERQIPPVKGLGTMLRAAEAAGLFVIHSS